MTRVKNNESLAQIRSLEGEIFPATGTPIQLGESRYESEILSLSADLSSSAGTREDLLKYEDLCYYLYLSLSQHPNDDTKRRLSQAIEGYCALQVHLLEKVNAVTQFRKKRGAEQLLMALNVHVELEQKDAARSVRVQMLPDFLQFYEELYNKNFGETYLFKPDPFMDFDDAQIKFEYLDASLNSIKKLRRDDGPDNFNELVPPGLPAAAAWRLARDFHSGKQVPMDRRLALCLYSYAVLCGDPRAICDYAFYYGRFDVYSGAEMPFAFLYEYLLHAMYICLRHSEGKLQFLTFETGYEYQGEQRSLLIDLLYNLSVLASAAMHSKNRDFYEAVDNDSDQFVEILAEEFKNHGFHDYRLNAAAVNFLDFFELLDSESLKEMLHEGGLIHDKEMSIKDLGHLLLEPGLKAGNQECLDTDMQCNGIDAESQHSIDCMVELSKRKCGRAAFALGACHWEGRGLLKKDVERARLWWKKAAAMGSGIAYFNLSLGHVLQNNLKGAAECAVKALDGGVLFAYYVLYRALMNENLELAHTYLRYSSEYLFPTAVTELSDLRRTGRYRPLPFMQSIEQIELLARRSATACVFLSSLYSGSGILPYDPGQSIAWMRKAAALGEADVFGNLSYIYGEAFGEHNDDTALPSFISAINGMEKYGNTLSGREDPHGQQISELILKLFEQLGSGTTSFERELFLNSLSSSFWQQYQIICDTEKFVALYPEDAFFYAARRFIATMDGDYQLRILYDYDKLIEQRVESLKLISQSQRRPEPLFESLWVANALRSLQNSYSVDEIKEHARRGANGQNDLCTIIDRLNLDFLGAKAISNAALAAEQDVFVLSVNQ
ncbi:MAG: sel1 repeat family protein [Succinivibrio sp.]|nr:sel1 repeat family protein [Succinivibrio sp.]